MTEHGNHTRIESEKFGWFDGIIEGRRTDDAVLQEGINSLNNVGLVHLDPEFDGGKFSLLADNMILPENRLTEARKEEFVSELSKLVTGMGSDSNIESTLRCSIVNGKNVEETIFAIQKGRLKPIARERDAVPSDFARQSSLNHDSAITSILPADKRLALLMLGLGAFLLIFMAWHSGLVQRFTSPLADDVTVEYGSLVGLVHMKVESSWGDYNITITRGPDYPVDKQKLEELLARDESMEVRASINAVSDGGMIYVRSISANDKVIFEKPVSLRRLIAGKDESVQTTLPGHMNTRAISLALYAAHR